MEIKEFKIGETFFASAGFKWLCTDKGTRTIIAIMLDPKKDEIWFKGPPYSVNEEIFDENDMKSCYLDDNKMTLQIIHNADESYHPGFLSEDVFKMMKERIKSETKRNYPRENLLKKDKVAKDGKIFHPYLAILKDNEWYIKVIELFSHEYIEIHEDEFVLLPYSDENALKIRKQTMTKKFNMDKNDE